MVRKTKVRIIQVARKKLRAALKAVMLPSALKLFHGDSKRHVEVYIAWGGKFR
jgi:hypothetical protein